MSSAISVRNVSKRFRIPLDHSTTLKYRVTHWRSSGRYHDLYALRDVSFDVGHGEFFGIIGPNGCGKSTLLKVLSRIFIPTSGDVVIDGRVSPFLELGVGFNPELTARENVFLNGAVLGLTRAELHERFDHIISFADLQEFVDQKLKNFSSGMQVRLAFSVAIQAKAQILLMDEVLAVGDARFQEKCFEVFWRYKREGKTVVLVTHDLASVEHYCDRVILLDHGRVLADGAPTETTVKYRRMVGEQFEEDDRVAMLDDDGVKTVERFGTSEVVITNVRILDGDGREVHTAATGSAIALEIEFKCNQDVGAFSCGMELHRADGMYLDDANTANHGITIPCPSPGETGRVTYVIDRLPLHAGSYLLGANLYDAHQQHAFDHIKLGFPLRVKEDIDAGGLLALSGRWLVGGREPAAARVRRTASSSRRS